MNQRLAKAALAIPAPCDDCAMSKACTAGFLACEVFADFCGAVEEGRRYRILSRKPNRTMYLRIFPPAGECAEFRDIPTLDDMRLATV